MTCYKQIWRQTATPAEADRSESTVQSHISDIVQHFLARKLTVGLRSSSIARGKNQHHVCSSLCCSLPAGHACASSCLSNHDYHHAPSHCYHDNGGMPAILITWHHRQMLSPWNRVDRYRKCTREIVWQRGEPLLDLHTRQRSELWIARHFCWQIGVHHTIRGF